MEMQTWQTVPQQALRCCGDGYKASTSAIGCGYMPPAHIIIMRSICCALQHIYLSSLSHLLFFPWLQKFCPEGFFLLSRCFYIQCFFFFLHPSSIHSSSAPFCIISPLLSLVLHPLWGGQAQSKVNTTQLAPNLVPKHCGCSPGPALL